MLLAIDIGNTQTVTGLFNGDKILSSWRMVTPKYETSDEIAVSVFNFLKNSGFNPEEISEIAISCVVPRIIDEIKKMGKRYFNCTPFIVNSDTRSDLIIKYDYPKENMLHMNFINI